MSCKCLKEDGKVKGKCLRSQLEGIKSVLDASLINMNKGYIQSAWGQIEASRTILNYLLSR